MPQLCLRRVRAVAVALLLATVLWAAPGNAHADRSIAMNAEMSEAAGIPAPDRADSRTDRVDLVALGWVWPLAQFTLVRPYVAPAHAYGPGHRGIDLKPLASVPVRAPAAGTVAFSGMVAGRGILTIDHGDGLVTTLEPIETALAPGTPVGRGEDVGTVAVGGHTAPGALHFGVRLDGEYINPLLMLGGVPRAVLLPCCTP